MFACLHSCFRRRRAVEPTPGARFPRGARIRVERRKPLRAVTAAFLARALE